MKMHGFLAGIALCAVMVILPIFAGADGGDGATQASGMAIQFFSQVFLAFSLIFAALLLTKKIAAWIDKNREKRKR